MAHSPSIVCPIDFSEASRTALHYAVAIADHFGARLTVVTVDDPVLPSVAADTACIPSLAHETEHELRRLVAETLEDRSSSAMTLDVRVEVGKPAPEILRVARDAEADLIVMSSHGLSGLSKRFFGSTTERVLRATGIPVLVTPKDGERVVSLSEMCQHIGGVVAPVDLTSASPHQVKVAAGVATALSVPMLLVHVLEPVFTPSARLAISGSGAERRADAEGRLLALATSSATSATIEALVVSGDPSEEIVKLAETRDAGLIVMGLHSSALFGPRMGSVTYVVLCLTHALVLALPPVPASPGALAD
jgi:universal stress protein A